MAEENRTKDQLAERYNALEEQYSLLRGLLDYLPDLIYAKDKESRFIFGNKAIARVMGVESPDDLVGKSDFDFYPEDLARKYFEDEQEFLNSGETILTLEQRRLDTKTNKQGWMLTTKMLFQDDDGNGAGVMGIGRDITELKETQHAAQEQLEIIKTQQEVLQELSTPIIPIMDHIIIMPLIGAIDTARSRDIMRSLLRGISEHRAYVIILDITGVPIVDTGVADHLNRTIQAARLRGAHTIVTGISDAVAETIVDLGIDWSNIDTLRDLQSGLKVALKRLNIQLNNG
jgi:PAS domain S-box-containing protein